MWALLLLISAERDWLGPEFERELAARAEAACGKSFRVRLSQGSPVNAIRELVGGEEGKEIYVQFLKDRYGYAIARVNEIYGREATSFTELLTDSFKGVDKKRREVAEDDQAFAQVLVARWSQAVEKGGRRCGAKAAPVVGVDSEGLLVTWHRRGSGPA